MGASIALALCDGSRKAIMYGTGSSSPTRPPQLPPATGHVPSACPKRIALGRLRRYGANDCLHQDKSIPLSAVQHRAVSHGWTCASRATAIDRGCAKTQAFIVRVESPSRFRQSENQKFWWRYREKAIKKNHSPHSWLAHVFTQAGPKAVVSGNRRLRFWSSAKRPFLRTVATEPRLASD